MYVKVRVELEWSVKTVVGLIERAGILGFKVAVSNIERGY